MSNNLYSIKNIELGKFYKHTSMDGVLYVDKIIKGLSKISVGVIMYIPSQLPYERFIENISMENDIKPELIELGEVEVEKLLTETNLFIKKHYFEKTLEEIERFCTYKMNFKGQ